MTLGEALNRYWRRRSLWRLIKHHDLERKSWLRVYEDGNSDVNNVYKNVKFHGGEIEKISKILFEI